MGAYAGRFFRLRAAAFPSAKLLLFWENTGFVAGMLLTACALYFTGAAFFGVAPAIAALLVLITMGLLGRSSTETPPTAS